MIQKSTLFLFFLLTSFLAKAQQSEYVQYNTKDGLAQSQVRAICQDKQGYIWFGTVGGLSRFDGYEFTNYSVSDGLPANQINCLYRGKENFWIGSSGSICKKTGLGFTSIPLPENYATSKISDMTEDGDSNLWLAFTGEGLLKYDGEVFTPFGEKEGLPNTYIRTIETAPDGIIWVGTRDGIAQIKNGKIISNPFPDIGNLSVSDITFRQDSTALISTFGNGILLIKGTKITTYNILNGLPTDHIRCAIELPNQELWLGSKDGLIRFSKGAFSLFQEAQGLPYSNVKTLGADREGNLWIGTDGQGVLLQAGRSFTSYSISDGLHSDLAMDICKTDTGSLVFASYDNGLALFDGKHFSPYLYNNELPSQTVWVINSDQFGTLWSGTSQGLFRENRGNTSILNETDGLPGNRVTALEQAGNGLWVGAENGFAKVSGGGKILQVFNDSTGFKGKRIRSLLKTEEGLWIGAEGSIYRYSDGIFIEKKIDPEEEIPIYCLVQDAFHYVWIGTSSGLYFLDPNTLAIEEVKIGSSFTSRNINFLTSLPDSTLLVGTNNGLYRLQVSDFHRGGMLKTKHYTNFEGLKSTETNQNSVFFDGRSVWFGTTSGIVKFDPYRDPFSTQVAPTLNLAKIQLFLQDVDWSTLADSVSVLTGLPQNLSLEYNQNYLTFYYSGIYLSNPDKVQYRYMLEGADEKWLGPTDSRSVTYAYLPHGDYSFRLQAYSEDAPELVNSIHFDFQITPPFYLTFWFFMLVGLLIIGLFYAIYINRIKKEHRKRATLQLEFQSRLMELESQSLNSSMNRHFIFNSLNSIQYYINMQDRKSANRYLTSFAKLIRKNLDSSQKNETSLSDELSRLELYLSLEQMRFQGRFDYTFHIDENLDTDQVQIPAMMLQPFLENSIWHGILPVEKHGIISLNITQSDDSVCIEILDNGVGYETSLSRKNGAENGHISKGMEITENRIELYRKMTGLKYEVVGPVELKSAEGTPLGTTVKISLPRPKFLKNKEIHI